MQLGAMYPGGEVVLVDYDEFCKTDRFGLFPESDPFLGVDPATGDKRAYYTILSGYMNYGYREPDRHATAGALRVGERVRYSAGRLHQGAQRSHLQRAHDAGELSFGLLLCQHLRGEALAFGDSLDFNRNRVD
jgi:hypothetical protein